MPFKITKATNQNSNNSFKKFVFFSFLSFLVMTPILGIMMLTPIRPYAITMRMIPYHLMFPFSYLSLICSGFGLACNLTSQLFLQKGRFFELLLNITIASLIAAIPGGILYGYHDMLLGHFNDWPGSFYYMLNFTPSAFSFLVVLLLLSMPFNFLCLFIGFYFYKRAVNLEFKKSFKGMEIKIANWLFMKNSQWKNILFLIYWFLTNAAILLLEPLLRMPTAFVKHFEINPLYLLCALLPLGIILIFLGYQIFLFNLFLSIKGKLFFKRI